MYNPVQQKNLDILTPHLSRLKKDIEDQLNWGPAEQWSNKEFEQFSETIQLKTGVALSYTTLKRILGRVKYDNSPSITSLDALSQFLGKENWREYCRTPPPSSSGIIQKFYKWGIVAFALILTGLGIMVFKPVITPAYNDLPFSSRTTSSEFPNTVMFDLSMPESLKEKFSIQLFWDPNRTVALKEGQTIASGIYYYPGYYRAKLLRENEILQEHDVYLKSQKWMATIDEKPIPLYISDEISFDQGLSISDSIKSRMITYSEPTYMTYHWVQPTDLSADNFELNTRINHTLETGSSVCQTFKLFVLCTKGAMIIPITKAGCVSEIGLMVSEKYLSGEENDLTAFSYDPSVIQHIRLKCDNQTLKVYLNENQIYKMSYKNSLGEIAGFRYGFMGTGEIKDLDLTSSLSGESLKMDFNAGNFVSVIGGELIKIK